MRFMRVGFAEEFFVEFLHVRVVVRLTDGETFVFTIESSCTFCPEGVLNVGILVGEEAVFDIRLTAACNAAARATHDLDEVIFALAGSDVVEKDFGVLHSVSDGNVDLHTVDLVSCFLDAFKTADFLKFP